jgi:putative FmdB family regulatory protein
MPNYDYECTKCGHKLEAFQKMNDAPLKKCPSCGEDSLRRLIGGGAGIIFKGSGFYATDYRQKDLSPKEAPACSKDNPGCSGCPHAS